MWDVGFLLGVYPGWVAGLTLVLVLVVGCFAAAAVVGMSNLARNV